LRVVAAFLANAAEERTGLIYVLGGFWDTVTIPKGQQLGFRGTLVVRLLAARAESGRNHLIELVCAGEDGQPIFNLNVNVNPQVPPEHPVGWEIPVTIVGGMAGPLPRIGRYAISILVDNTVAAEVPFRVVEGPAMGASPPGAQTT
jgi:hypothetical protein